MDLDLTSNIHHNRKYYHDLLLKKYNLIYLIINWIISIVNNYHISRNINYHCFGYSIRKLGISCGININIPEVRRIAIIISQLILSQKKRLRYYKHSMILRLLII